MAIENLKNQNTQTVGINSCQWMPFDDIPSAFYDFWRGIPSRIRNQATVCLLSSVCDIECPVGVSGTDIDNRIIFLHRAQDVKSSQLPFAALTCKD